ncbi:MAG: hypothetical protein NTW90_04330 [Nitrosospira sp.]|nr:hypothetical protein [Nitrosospira sp.]
MDTLAIIRDKAERLAQLLPKSGILSVVRHIEMAERHFDVARRDAESDLFVDVIYRANHTFEGILREAYAILAGQDSSGKSAYEIEQYLSKNAVFQDRVMDLFTNYRSKWRNPSTHDHVATFSESEAFLAILSVTLFSGILMDQMIACLAFEQQQRRLAIKTDELRKVVIQHSGEPILDRVTFLLQTFAADPSLPAMDTEIEFVAAVRAFLSTVEPNIELVEEPILRDSMGTLRPDLLLRQGKEVLVVELKRYRRWTIDNQRTAFDQVRRYVDAAQAIGGILVLLPSKDAVQTDERYYQVLSEIIDDDKMIVTVRIPPRSKTVQPGSQEGLR